MAYVEICLSNGSVIYAEAEEGAPPPKPVAAVENDGSKGPSNASLGGIAVKSQGPTNASLPGEKALARVDFDSVLSTVKGVARDMASAMRGLDVGPDSYEITFGVKIAADAGVVFARAGAEASFEVKLTWEGLRATRSDAATG